MIAADLRVADAGQAVLFDGGAPRVLLGIDASTDGAAVTLALAGPDGMCLERVEATTEIAMDSAHLTHRAVTEPDDDLRARLIAELHRVSAQPNDSQEERP